jgi:hypothetical protein
MWPGILAQLEALEMSPARLQRAKVNLQRAERLVDLLFASATGLKRLFDVAILRPMRGSRRRRGAAALLSPAGKSPVRFPR